MEKVRRWEGEKTENNNHRGHREHRGEKNSLPSGILPNHVANIEFDVFIVMMIIKPGNNTEISKLLLQRKKISLTEFRLIYR
jgi:hypothetical protein